jgi:hypothetical protein
MGHCGHHQLSLLPKCVDGTPTAFLPHPFQFDDCKEQARVQKQPIGHNPEKAPEPKMQFFMDFGFMHATCFNYRLPWLGINCVVECFKGYLVYLIIVDECSRYVWEFLRKSKEHPVNLVKAFLAIHGSLVGGAICTDQGGELAQSTSFRTNVYKATEYAVESTDVDSASQNGGAKKWNHTLAVTTWAPLYGARLSAHYWSAALLHAAYLHNRRVHAITKMTLFKGWFGRWPNLKQLRVFGSCVCVRQTGKQRVKLDHHHFDGIFIGYTAINQNI